MANGRVKNFSQNRDGNIEYNRRPVADITPRLGLRKTSLMPELTSIELKPILSGGGVSIDTLTTEKSVLVGRISSNETGILRKPSRYRCSNPSGLNGVKTTSSKSLSRDITASQGYSKISAESSALVSATKGSVSPHHQNSHKQSVTGITPNKHGVSMDVKPIAHKSFNPIVAQQPKVSTHNNRISRPSDNINRNDDISEIMAANIVRKRKMLDFKPVAQLNSAKASQNHGFSPTGPNKVVQPPKKVVRPVSTPNNQKPANSVANNHSRLNFVAKSTSQRRINHKFSKDLFADVPSLPIPKYSRIKSIFKNLKNSTKKQKSGYALMAFAAILLIFGVSINLHGFMVNKKIEAQASAVSGADTDSDGRPTASSGYSEDQPTNQAVSKYTVAPDMPKTINISSLGVLSRVIRVGSDNTSGEIGSPKNVFDTAWYEGSAKPGERGAVFIDGHVSGPTKGGVFAGLKNIKPGAVIVITMGNDTKYTYKVAAIEKFDADKVDMKKVLSPYDPTKQGLNIMTCNGKFLKDTQTFDKRLVVYAVREN